MKAKTATDLVKKNIVVDHVDTKNKTSSDQDKARKKNSVL